MNHYEYDAFGNTVVSEEQVHNRFRYNGQQFDPMTSQYYLRARFYNPVIGRFTQEDAYYGDGLNLYQYCASNPMMYEDPSGHNKVCSPGNSNLQGKNQTDDGNKQSKNILNLPDTMNYSSQQIGKKWE